MQYSQLTPEQKVAFYNDLCEEPFAGDVNLIAPATTALLKASGWGLDEINDNFKQFVEEQKCGDGQPSKCTVELGLEAAPAPTPEAPTPTPPKRGRKKASVPAQASQQPAPAPTGNGAEAASADASAPAETKKSGLIPRQPKVTDEQHLYPGLGKVSGIRAQFKTLAGPNGCTMAELIARYDVSGVSTSAKNKDSATSFVRGYVNNGLRPDVDLFRLQPVTPDEKAAHDAAQAAAPAPAPAPTTAAPAPQPAEAGAV